MPLVFSVDTVYYYDHRVAQRINRKYIYLGFLCRKLVPCFLVYRPHAISQTKSYEGSVRLNSPTT